ncbi:MAG: YjjG family noncanonical pyrimidine nucleotidase [Candidatus Caccosoma sp.]|nr:YjjG family noncanonical pyrimidine nucleotidase [Candidatus Caccosoma sp.]
MLKLDNIKIIRGKNNCNVKGTSLYNVLINDSLIAYISLRLVDNEAYFMYKRINKKYYKYNYETSIIRLFCKYLTSKAKIVYCLNKMSSYLAEVGFIKDDKMLKLDINKLYFINDFKYLLFDVDDTLLSFEKSERKALTLALNKYHIKATNKLINDYHLINIKYWKMVEKGIISRDECLIKRFDEFLVKNNINVASIDFEDTYRYYLNKQAFLVKDAKLILKELEKNKQIYAITNGVYKTQKYRIKKAKLEQFFIHSFISDEIKYNKPSKLFMDYVCSYIKDFNKDEALIIGDSLSSDIKLGINSNVKTCYFNFKRLKNNDEIKPTYVIYSLKELI